MSTRTGGDDGLGGALARIGTTVDVESVLSCWFDADDAPIEETFDLARRAAYLNRRIGAAFPLERVIYSAEVGCQKHDPRFIESASGHLGLTAAWPLTRC